MSSMSRKRNRLSMGAGTIICLFLACSNPFFPPTGIPSQGKAPRSTPSGVIDQLIESYESRRLDLFTDLLPKDKTFQFYVAPSFESVYQSRYNLPQEPRDTTLQYIGESPQYYYWNQVSEENRHQNLFSKASEIEFISKPETMIRYIENEKGDTIKAEVVMTGGELLVSAITQGQVLIDQPVSIEKQVFLMVKNDDDHLWVIKKWYDLSSAPSSDL
jgi:hypothetical protein